MKKIILLVTVSVFFLFTACENDQFTDIDSVTATETQTIQELPAPPEQAKALNTSENMQQVIIEPNALIASELPTKERTPSTDEVTSRSCIEHYDMPVFYSYDNGRFRTEERTACFDRDYPIGGYRRTSNIGSGFALTIPLEDDFSYGDDRGLYMAYEQYGRLKIGSVDKHGVRRDVQNYNWVDYWTHMMPLQNGMFMFYSSIYGGKIYIGRYTPASGWQYVNSYGSWLTEWSDFVHLGNGKVVTYSRSTGKLFVNQIDNNGNWSVITQTNIGSGKEQIVALGRQEEVRGGICCYHIGTGFMAYDAGNRLDIYNISNTNNQVSLRTWYNTSGWVFDIFAQLQGNKFIVYNNSANIARIGYFSTLGVWQWDMSYYTDATNYSNIFTMSFR